MINTNSNLFTTVGKATTSVGSIEGKTLDQYAMELYLAYQNPENNPYTPSNAAPLTTVADFTYTYDQNTNVTYRDYPDGAETFTYDA